MRCCSCKRNIAAGPDFQKVVIEYLQADESLKIFGYMMPDGPLSAATGQLQRAFHHKCYHVVRKRGSKGEVPTAYEVEERAAASAAARIATARSDDPGYTEPSERDWRHHVVLDIEDMQATGER